MTTQALFREIETLSPVQRESVYSFVYLLKHPGYTPPAEGVEPFATEREAMDFANDCTLRMLRETR